MGAHHAVATSVTGLATRVLSGRKGRVAADAVAVTAAAAALAGVGTGIASADGSQSYPATVSGHHRAADAECRDASDEPDTDTDAASGGVFDGWTASPFDDDTDCSSSADAAARADDGTAASASTDGGDRSTTRTAARPTDGASTERAHRPSLNPLDVPPPPGQVRTIKLPGATAR